MRVRPSWSFALLSIPLGLIWLFVANPWGYKGRAVSVDYRGGYQLDSAWVEIETDENRGTFIGPETRFLRGIAGYSMFENLYTSNGVLYAITSNPSSIPDLSTIMSDESIGTPEDPFPVADERRFAVISPHTALLVFAHTEGTGEQIYKSAARLSGPTFFFNDGPSERGYLPSYFHFGAEVFAGAWRVLTACPQLIKKGTITGMQFPRRVILPRGEKWRDWPRLNPWLLATLLPSTHIEDWMQWNDRSISGNLYIFDSIVIVDRWASHRHNPGAQTWNKMNGDVFTANPAPSDWWHPLRTAMMNSIGIAEQYDKTLPVVTYVSRQLQDRRTLNGEDHDALVTMLSDMPEIEFNVVQLESLSRQAQMKMIARTDILVAVHGLGLTNQMFMREGRAVIEIFDTGGFTRDYQILAEAFKHEYFALWENEIYDWKTDKPGYKEGDNFQGTEIRISAPLVESVISKLVKKTSWWENKRPSV